MCKWKSIGSICKFLPFPGPLIYQISIQNSYGFDEAGPIVLQHLWISVEVSLRLPDKDEVVASLPFGKHLVILLLSLSKHTNCVVLCTPRARG